MDSKNEELKAKLKALLIKANLIAWLEGQDLNKTYDYRFTDACGLSKFIEAQGYDEDIRVDNDHIFEKGYYGEREKVMDLPPGWDDVARPDNYRVSGHPYDTLGAMLKRARRLPD